MEIERKFTIKQLPENLNGYPCRLIEQAYLNTNPVIRIRREDDRYYMTYKGEGLMAREEYNLPLNADAYAHLLPKADGNVISKKRYLIPLNHSCCRTDAAVQTLSGAGDSVIPPHTGTSGSDTPSRQGAQEQNWQPMIELDIFAAPFDGLIIAEVEFPSVEAAHAFVAPAWFDEDVTNDPAYHNSNLSRRTF